MNKQNDKNIETKFITDWPKITIGGVEASVPLEEGDEIIKKGRYWYLNPRLSSTDLILLSEECINSLVQSGYIDGEQYYIVNKIEDEINMHIPSDDLGNYLKILRRERNKTLREVESESGVSNAHLSQIENGRIKYPARQILQKIADCYRINVDLLTIKLPPPKHHRKASSNDTILSFLGKLKITIGDMISVNVEGDQITGTLSNAVVQDFGWFIIISNPSEYFADEIYVNLKYAMTINKNVNPFVKHKIFKTRGKTK